MGTNKYQTPQPDDEKMRELIIYLANKCEDDQRFGATKLNKLLFFADFFAYLYLGHAITGHEYQVLEWGPAPRRLLPIRQQLIADNAIVIIDTDIGSEKPLQRTIAKRQANLDVFSAAEISLVDGLIGQWWNRDAKEMSNLTHTFAGWRLGEEGETIPYEVILVGVREPTPLETSYGLQLEDLAKECLSE